MYVYHSGSFDFRKSIVEFRKNPVGQKRCSEFDSLHMLKFHDFVDLDHSAHNQRGFSNFSQMPRISGRKI